MSYKRHPSAFNRGEVPIGTLPAIEQADHWFTTAYRELTTVGRAANGIEILFGRGVASALLLSVGGALAAMEALWGAVDTLADDQVSEAPSRLLLDELYRRGEMVGQGLVCNNAECNDYRTVIDPACGHEKVRAMVYVGGEDLEPF